MDPVPNPDQPPTAHRATLRGHERLGGRQAFQNVFSRRRSVSDAQVVVYAAGNGRDHARVGISVGRKKVRRATDRNRVKRLIREVFRTTKSLWPAGIDYVIVPRGPGLDFHALREALPRLAQAAARRLPRDPAPAPPEPR